MLVIGLFLLVLGIFMATKTEVTCGTEVMQAGDVCQTTKRGQVTSTATTEERAATQRAIGLVAAPLGGALTAGAIVWMILAKARRKPAAAASAPVASA